MAAPLMAILRAPLDWLADFAASLAQPGLPPLTVADTFSPDQRLAALAAWLEALHARGAFNGTVLIARRGAILFEKHCGFADVDRAVPLSAHSSFSLASVSKPITALAIMLLARDGKLKLDDAMARHIPELARYGGITIRQLLHHTSGLPDYMELADAHWDARRLLTTADLIDLLIEYRPQPYFAPGAQFEYSNTGYALLGEIIARASAMPYPEFMAREIFAPLGMKDSAAFNLASGNCPLPSRAFGMRRRIFGGKVRCDLNYLDGAFGDGGIYASAEDLVRLDRALREGTLMPADVYAEAYRPGRLKDGEETRYGFGWQLGPSGVVFHWGSWQGFTAYVRRDLSDGALLVLLSNLAPAAPVEAVSAALERLVAHV
jgi:CubicO group peptidase (beta-lactamase class C family)